MTKSKQHFSTRELQKGLQIQQQQRTRGKGRGSARGKGSSGGGSSNNSTASRQKQKTNKTNISTENATGSPPAHTSSKTPLQSAARFPLQFPLLPLPLPQFLSLLQHASAAVAALDGADKLAVATDFASAFLPLVAFVFFFFSFVLPHRKCILSVFNFHLKTSKEKKDCK